MEILPDIFCSKSRTAVATDAADHVRIGSRFAGKLEFLTAAFRAGERHGKIVTHTHKATGYNRLVFQILDDITKSARQSEKLTDAECPAANAETGRIASKDENQTRLAPARSINFLNRPD
jgi:hypothetical protein